MTRQEKRLRYAADLNPSVRADLLEAQETEVSFLPMEDIGEDGTILLGRTRPVAEVRNGYTYFEDGDVAFAKVTPCFENGKGALMRDLEGGAGFGTSELTVLRPKRETSARFLNYAVQTAQFRKLGAAAMTGAGGLKRVPDEFTRNFKIPFPPLADQERIANFLDEKTARIDALIAEKERLVERLLELKHAELSHLATGQGYGGSMRQTGHPALPEIPANWTLSRLKWVSILLRDGTHTPPPRVDQGVPLLSVRNVQNDRFGFLPDDSLISEKDFLELNRSFDVRTGDVLLAVVGATMGKVAVVENTDQPFQIQRSLAVIRPRHDMTLPELLATQMRSEYFQNLLWQSTGFSAQPGIYLGALANFPVPIPPVAQRFPLVQKIQQRSAQISSMVCHVQEHISRLREYRSSLISAAVTGQLNIDEFEMRRLEAA